MKWLFRRDVFRRAYRRTAAHGANFRRDLDLLLIDVVTGDQILEKEKFYQAEVNTEQGIGSFIFSFQLRYITMEFSPDGRYFVASSKNGNPIAYSSLLTRA